MKIKLIKLENFNAFDVVSVEDPMNPPWVGEYITEDCLYDKMTNIQIQIVNADDQVIKSWEMVEKTIEVKS